METIGIIGGMGSGKSSVARLLKDAGIPVLDLDVVGHEILRIPVVKRQLVQAFSSDIISKKQGDTQINRAALAAKAFSSPENTAKLNAITQPIIEAAAQKWKQEKEAAGHTYAAIEISAFDADQESYNDLADRIVAVITPDVLREGRACAKGFAIEDVRRRMARQPSNQEYRSWADFVIENTGTPEDLHFQVRDLLSKI